MFLIIFKRFTAGTLKGLHFEDRLTVKTKSDLEFLDLIGTEIKSNLGSHYSIDNVYIYDKATDNYLTRKQAELKLEGW